MVVVIVVVIFCKGLTHSQIFEKTIAYTLLLSDLAVRATGTEKDKCFFSY